MSKTVEQSVSGSELESKLSSYKEMLSALSDGELAADEVKSLIDFLKLHAEESLILKNYWFRIHKGKSILHKDWDSASGSDMKLLEKLSEALIGSDFINEPVNTTVVDFSKAKQLKEEKQKNLPVLQSVAVAASMMFVVLAGWFGVQTEQRQNLLALFSSDEAVVQEHYVAQDSGKVFRKNGLIEVSAGNLSSRETSTDNINENFHLDARRIEQYMMLHAENASLNSNQGIIPFARVSHLEQSKEF